MDLATAKLVAKDTVAFHLNVADKNHPMLPEKAMRAMAVLLTAVEQADHAKEVAATRLAQQLAAEQEEHKATKAALASKNETIAAQDKLVAENKRLQAEILKIKATTLPESAPQQQETGKKAKAGVTA
jgi:hypothetical protein